MNPATRPTDGPRTQNEAIPQQSTHAAAPFGCKTMVNICLHACATSSSWQLWPLLLLPLPPLPLAFGPLVAPAGSGREGVGRQPKTGVRATARGRRLVGSFCLLLDLLLRRLQAAKGSGNAAVRGRQVLGEQPGGGVSGLRRFGWKLLLTSGPLATHAVCEREGAARQPGGRDSAATRGGVRWPPKHLLPQTAPSSTALFCFLSLCCHPGSFRLTRPVCRPAPYLFTPTLPSPPPPPQAHIPTHTFNSSSPFPSSLCPHLLLPALAHISQPNHVQCHLTTAPLLLPCSPWSVQPS